VPPARWRSLSEVSTVADVGYLVAGYGGTAAALLWYRWRLSRRGERARGLIAALSGRPVREGRRGR
jgi:hypothetical protein